MNYRTATVTIPQGTYPAEALVILLGVPNEEVDRLMGPAARMDLAKAVPAGWRRTWRIRVDPMKTLLTFLLLSLAAQAQDYKSVRQNWTKPGAYNRLGTPAEITNFETDFIQRSGQQFTEARSLRVRLSVNFRGRVRLEVSKNLVQWFAHKETRTASGLTLVPPTPPS